MNIPKYTHSDPLPMGGHRSLIQEQFRSFEEPGPQDSCVGFFVSSQALRNLLKWLHSWTVSGQCRVPVIPALSRLRQEDDQAWGQLGLPSEVPLPLPPKKNEGGRRAAVSHPAVWTVCLRDLCLLTCLQRSPVFSYPSHVRPSTQAADCTVDVSDLIHNLLYDIAFQESDNYVSCFFVLNGTGNWTQNQC